MRRTVGRLAALGGVVACLLVPQGAAAIEPLAEIGSPGPGAGQLGSPQGVAIDGAGTIAVVDAGLRRVSRFDASGAFVDAFGQDTIPGGGTGFESCTTATGCKTGTNGFDAGEFTSPLGLAMTSSGDRIAVADPPSNRISEFGGEPSFLHGIGYDTIPGGALGFELCTIATTCQAGTSGNGVGQLSSPLTGDYAPSGNLIALNPVGQFQEYDANRGPIRSFGFPGSGPGNLATPYDLTIGPGGELVVADSSNSRISVFGPNGNFLRAFGFNVIPGGPNAPEVCTQATGCVAGSPIDDAGALNAPVGVGLGPGGEVYVAEVSNNRVSQFSLDGRFVRAFGFDVDPGGGVGFETCTEATGCQVGAPGAGFGQLSAPWGVAVDCRGTVFVAESSAGQLTAFGEPGARKPPCPSNAFTLGTAKRNKRKGTATLPVTVPGPGALSLDGKNLKPGDLAPSVAGELTLKIKPKGKLKRKLKRKGKAKTEPAVTYTPTNGDPNTQSTQIRLKRKQR